MFRLYLNTPKHNRKNEILYFLSNARVTDIIRAKALKAIENDKLEDGFGTIFKDELTPQEVKILKDKFYQTAHNWVQNKSIFGVLTKGTNPDIALAKEVLTSENYHHFVRSSAFEVILDRDKNISLDIIKNFINDPETRSSAIQTINRRLDGYHSRGEITKEELITLIKPLTSFLEDLALLADDHELKQYNSILDLIYTTRPAGEN